MFGLTFDTDPTPQTTDDRLVTALKGKGGVMPVDDYVLPTDSAVRKEIPIFSGVLNYFPLAIAAVARVSKRGNDQHNPGQPMHWAREKSTDHADCILRHMIERGTLDTDGILHDAKVAWRALAQLQLAIEKIRSTP